MARMIAFPVDAYQASQMAFRVWPQVARPAMSREGKAYFTRNLDVMHLKRYDRSISDIKKSPSFFYKYMVKSRIL